MVFLKRLMLFLLTFIALTAVNVLLFGVIVGIVFDAPKVGHELFLPFSTGSIIYAFIHSFFREKDPFEEEIIREMIREKLTKIKDAFISFVNGQDTH